MYWKSYLFRLSHDKDPSNDNSKSNDFYQSNVNYSHLNIWHTNARWEWGPVHGHSVRIEDVVLQLCDGIFLVKTTYWLWCSDIAVQVPSYQASNLSNLEVIWNLLYLLPHLRTSNILKWELELKVSSSTRYFGLLLTTLSSYFHALSHQLCFSLPRFSAHYLSQKLILFKQFSLLEINSSSFNHTHE